MMHRTFGRPARVALLALLLPSLAFGASTAADPPAAAPTVEEAARYVAEAERRLLELGLESGRAQWVQANFITVDTEALAALANERLTAATVELATGAARFNDLELPADVRRKLNLLRQSLSAPAPADPAKIRELSQIMAGLEAAYGRGEYCPPGATGDACLDVEEITEIMATSRDPEKLEEVWVGWHAIAPPMKDDYARFVELTGEGARELGYDDLGALWRSRYDMTPAAFAAELDRLWQQVEPLYDELHCYVRAKLVEKYGAEVVPPNGPIPAHLLGNIWAQEWGNIYDLVGPGEAKPAVDITARLAAKGVEPLEMVRIAERFFTSLGFEALPPTFWERSLFTQPRDRDVVCHASAWDLDIAQKDVRIKMCTDVNAEDFQTIHHELGHVFYYLSYAQQPLLYRDGAHDGFHEAVGDAIALSMTPKYLKQIGLIEEEPPADQDINLLLRDAIDKIAFLPFGLLIDQWRWKVFSGEVPPERYNQAWWELREKYQGVAAPVARSEADFDPGAKYHIPGNTPYTRYFLARILQFQFHRSLCAAAGETGPLHRCSIYGNEAAGKRLRAGLALGASEPWPVAMEALTGGRQMDASAIVDYFAPLMTWLEEQNEGRSCGWTASAPASSPAAR